MDLKIPGLLFTDGDVWEEQRRFTLRHLRDLGFGRTSSENLIQEEIHDVMDEIRTEAETSNGIVKFNDRFNMPLMNILWAIVAGERFKHDDDKLNRLLYIVNLFVRSGNAFIRSAIPLPNFLLRLFPFIKKKFIGTKYDLYPPIQDFIRV